MGCWVWDSRQTLGIFTEPPGRRAARRAACIVRVWRPVVPCGRGRVPSGRGPRVARSAPCPPLPKEVETYGNDVRRRLLVKPGMTGLWQISGRSGLSWDQSVRFDLYYVENWSVMSDLMILWRRGRAVLPSSGAY